MNRTILIGRPTRDAEIRVNGEKKIARFTVAVDRYNSDADFINCVAFDKKADFAEKYLRKGQKIAICGSIKTGSYTNKDGVKVYTTDVYVDDFDFCESKGTQAEAPVENTNSFMAIPEGEELPFN